MGRTIHQACKQIILTARAGGFEEQIGWPDLQRYIEEIAGSHKQTITLYRKKLQTLGFLESTNAFVFKLTDKAKALVA